MITQEQYIGKWQADFAASAIHAVNAAELLRRVNALFDHLALSGVRPKTNPITGCAIGGETLGGFRPHECPIGSPSSAHKTGEAIDIYDPLNELDSYITKNPDLLVKFDLYREHPMSTNHWMHLSIRKPDSGNRTFMP